MLAAFQLSEPFALYRLLVGRQAAYPSVLKTVHPRQDEPRHDAQQEQKNKPDRNNDDDRSVKVHHRSNRSGAH